MQLDEGLGVAVGCGRKTVAAGRGGSRQWMRAVGGGGIANNQVLCLGCVCGWVGGGERGEEGRGGDGRGGEGAQAAFSSSLSPGVSKYYPYYPY